MFVLHEPMLRETQVICLDERVGLISTIEKLRADRFQLADLPLLMCRSIQNAVSRKVEATSVSASQSA